MHNVVYRHSYIGVVGVDVALRWVAACKEVSVDGYLASRNASQWVGRAARYIAVYKEYCSRVYVLVAASSYVYFLFAEAALPLV